MTPAAVDIKGSISSAVMTVAGGCFWCIEPAFQETAGVIDVVVGYAGGTSPEPTYEQVASGQTDYKEAAQISYNPSQISYEELLAIYWRSIDPTDAGGQFVDRGYHYTTTIYYHTDEQKTLAEQSRAEKQEELGQEVATTIEPYTSFYLAEDYHQDFYLHSAERYQRYKK